MKKIWLVILLASALATQISLGEEHYYGLYSQENIDVSVTSYDDIDLVLEARSQSRRYYSDDKNDFENEKEEVFAVQENGLWLFKVSIIKDSEDDAEKGEYFLNCKECFRTSGWETNEEDYEYDYDTVTDLMEEKNVSIFDGPIDVIAQLIEEVFRILA